MKLGDISPAAGIATGEGMIGKLAGKGGLGLLPAAIARNAQEDEEERKRRAAGGMKKGGAVSASRRADGIAQRGKTRGKMV
jgi:hypothetical protein